MARRMIGGLAAAGLMAGALLGAGPGAAQSNAVCRSQQNACNSRCASLSDTACIQACGRQAARCYSGQSGGAGPAPGVTGPGSSADPFARSAASSGADPFSAAAPTPPPSAAPVGAPAEQCVTYVRTAEGGVAWRNDCEVRVNLSWRTDDPAERCYSPDASFTCGQMVEPLSQSVLQAITGNYVMAACVYPGIPAVGAGGAAACR